MQLFFEVAAAAGVGAGGAGVRGPGPEGAGAGERALRLWGPEAAPGEVVPRLKSKISKMMMTIPEPTNRPMSQDGIPVGGPAPGRAPGRSSGLPVRAPKLRRRPGPLSREHHTRGKIPGEGRRARRTEGRRYPPVPDAAGNCRRCCNNAGHVHTGSDNGGIEAW